MSRPLKRETRMLFALVALIAQFGRPPSRNPARPSEFLDTLGDQLVLAGPFLDDKGDMVGSIVVVEAETLDAAREIFGRDPFMQGNLFDSVTIKPWRLGVNKTHK